MGDLKPVSSGQPLRISASDFNACLDAAKAHRIKKVLTAEKQPSIQQSDLILVKNTTASDRDFLDVLAIDVPLILPTESLNEWRSRVALSCIAPGTTHAGRYVVLQEPIPAGKLGRAMVIGVTPVNLDVVAETDRFAEVADGVTASLKTGTTGSARVLWKESGTGAKRGVVMLTGEVPSSDFTGPLIPDESSLQRLTASTTKVFTSAGWYWLTLTGGGGGGGGGDTTSTPVSGWRAGGGGGASGRRVFCGPVYIQAGWYLVYTHATGGSAGAASSSGGAGGNAILSLYTADDELLWTVTAYGGTGGGTAGIWNTSETKGIEPGYGGRPGPSASGTLGMAWPSIAVEGHDGRVVYQSGISPPTTYAIGRGGWLEHATYGTNDAGSGGGGGDGGSGDAGQAGALDIVGEAAFSLADP